MKFFYFAIILFSLSLSAGPIPFSGKLSVRGVNFTGSAEFVFQVIDKNGQVHWSNGADENTTISVPVRNGRYLVLLGGQGMSELPSQLFLEKSKLFLRVQVDLKDGKGLRHLDPDQRITSNAHSLSSDLAQLSLLAEEAKVARELKSGAITNQMLSESLKQDIAAPVSVSRLDPTLKAYLAPLLEPKPTSTVTDRDRMEGGSVTLSAPSASGQNLSYQWKRNGTPILGATSKDLVMDDLNATLHSGNYKVVVSNDFGSFSQQLALNIFEATPVQMVAGDNHVLYLDAIGFPYSLGFNENRLVGLEAANSSVSSPNRILDEPVAGISTSTNLSLILKKDDSLWGLGTLNDLGLGSPNIPVKITDGPIKDFAAGESAVYVVRPDGSLWSAGINKYGRLGDGTTEKRSTLVKVIDSGVDKVFSKGKYAAVIKEDGSLWTFGLNQKGSWEMAHK